MSSSTKKEKKEFKQITKEFLNIPQGELKSRLWPITLFVALVALDQITKALVVAYMPLIEGFYQSESISVVGDWIKLTHVRNQGVAWSGLQNLVGFGRIILLIVLPLTFVSLFSIWTFFSKELTKFQRWASTMIIAGGIGNLIDRIFRYASGPNDKANGVVDFMDMAFPKIPYLTPSGRWPTWNVADASIVVGVSLLIISMIILEIQTNRKKQEK